MKEILNNQLVQGAIVSLICALVAFAINYLKKLADEKGIKINIDSETIIENICHRAIDYAEEQGHKAEKNGIKLSAEEKKVIAIEEASKNIAINKSSIKGKIRDYVKELIPNIIESLINAHRK